ncbi:hypothetical protein [uncultured Campylobacter sp.]|uniref:hypothetical protein n=1 Tax=uncultured Campylobacter sp. TaxID=218934 RepID=UPI0028E3CC42|nr:hypothetical protein [uncultured Campylobacter sp.]
MIASGTARAGKFKRSARPSGLAACTWIKFKASVEFKGCEISNTRGISDFCGILKRRGILNIMEFKRREISNASKISRPCARAFKDGAVSQVFAGRRNCG